MAAQNKSLEVTLESIFDSVDLAEDIVLRVAASSGFDEESRYRIGMSVREAMINAVEYGNRRCRDKKIVLTLDPRAEKLEIHVLDQGAGFDLGDVPDPLAEENLLKTSGRGIFLIRAFMDEFEVRRSPQGGADVVMAKRYSPRSAGSEPLAAPKKED